MSASLQCGCVCVVVCVICVELVFFFIHRSFGVYCVVEMLMFFFSSNTFTLETVLVNNNFTTGNKQQHACTCDVYGQVRLQLQLGNAAICECWNPS